MPAVINTPELIDIEDIETHDFTHDLTIEQSPARRARPGVWRMLAHKITQYLTPTPRERYAPSCRSAVRNALDWVGRYPSLALYACASSDCQYSSLTLEHRMHSGVQERRVLIPQVAPEPKSPTVPATGRVETSSYSYSTYQPGFCRSCGNGAPTLSFFEPVQPPPLDSNDQTLWEGARRSFCWKTGGDRIKKPDIWTYAESPNRKGFA
jgi:hypothetical protein